MLRGPVLCVAATAVLAGCSAGAGVGHRSVKDCSDRVGFNQRAAAARAAGVTGNIHATPEELAAINACVAGGRGTAAAPVSARTPVVAVSTPSSTLARPVPTVAKPAPATAQPAPPVAQPVPVTPAPRQQTVRGNLPLPTQYPLMPGDADLWPTLTLAEQQRALLYLKDGSTIRSSLGAN
ncbi:MAG: hypothetical protein B7Z02_07820 [Rhodobacterales bacterium 32-67-9]|nr:MAG: hypothetical protein B7Z02_07820 [Rhodobacterales bacterium 32-67-9]